MKAVLTTAHGGRETISVVTDFPDPVVGREDVLVRVAATAINFHDVFTRRGMPGIKIPLPIIVGSDIAGTVEAVGPEVTGWAPGDRVLIDPVYRVGPRFGMIGEVSHGGRAELIAVPARQLLPVPDAVSLEDAAALPLAYGTAYRMLVRQGRMAAGERILILGASGGVGVACVQLAKIFGLEVVAGAGSRNKAERLRAIGADHVIDYSSQSFVDGIRTLFGKPRITGEGGVDIAVNFTGGDTWIETQKCVRKGGRILTCGATAGYAVTTDVRYLWTFEHEMIGSNGWEPDDLRALMGLIADGRLKPIIDQVLLLEEAAEAERLLEDREVVGKILLRPNTAPPPHGTRRDVVNLGDLLCVDGKPDDVILIDQRPGGRSWTRGAIEQAVAAIGRDLVSRGLQRGDRIAIVADNSAEYMLVYLGVMRACMVAVPVNIRLPAETIAFILADCSANLVFSSPLRVSLVPDGIPMIALEEAIGSIDILSDRERTAAVTPRPGEVAEILYTSGSTGRPKGVPLSHQGQLWALSHHVNPKPSTGDTTLVVAPMYHMNALFASSVGLLNDLTIVLMPRFEPRAWLTAIAEYRCSLLTGIPTMYAMAAREKDLLATLDLRSVKTVSIGSAPLTDRLRERVSAMFPSATIIYGYGTTEAGPSVFGPHPEGKTRPKMSLGYPLGDISWRLTGGTGDEGVLELKTPALMSEYLNLPEATADRVRDGWYNTGDILRHDQNGFFFFVGRADDMFVCGGENVYPGEVEKMLERHPDVAQAAVVPVTDALKGQIPIAFVVPAPGASPTPDDLKAFSLREGPAYRHPRAFVLIGELPLAGTHKVDRNALLERAKAIGEALGRDREDF